MTVSQIKRNSGEGFETSTSQHAKSDTTALLSCTTTDAYSSPSAEWTTHRSLPKFGGTLQQFLTTNFPISISVTPDEEKWLKANPLQPIASFDGAGTVQIKLYKEGLTGAQFMANIVPYRTYKYSQIVETCFDFTIDDQVYQFTNVRNYGIHPAITKVTRDYDAIDDGKVGITWSLVSVEDSEKLIDNPIFQKKLGEVMADNAATLTENGAPTQITDYVELIRSKLGGLNDIEGGQEYDVNTHIHTYVQHVEVAGLFASMLSNHFGSDQIIGATLKVAYRALGEPVYAGKKGEYGPEVKGPDGVVLQAGL